MIFGRDGALLICLVAEYENLFSWLNQPYDMSKEEEILVLNST